MTGSVDPGRFLPILRARQPSAEQLLPYLREIDATRMYSNSGPLSRRLEERLTTRFDAASGGVALVANATLGLALSLQAQGAQAGTLCVVPAWTHIATVQAARLAGLTPYFVDVSPDTWTLDPSEMNGVVRGAPGEVGAVMPVCAFGRPIDFPAWDRFRERSGLPTVIDAAAAFDTVQPTAVPAVVSMHATKVFAIGEGGFVLSTDPEVVEAVRVRANLGFMGDRVEQVPGLNAKLSEYHAAAGLASLDEWSIARNEWMTAAALYREGLSHCPGLGLQDGFGRSWVSSTCVIDLGGDSTPFETKLSNAGIETRRWWEYGAHLHPTTLHLPRAASLAVTERLAHSTLAVPVFRDIERPEIDRVIAGLTAVVDELGTMNAGR